MTGTVSLLEVDEALRMAAPRLDLTGQRVGLATYVTLAEGRPASAVRIAHAAGERVETVEQMLDAWPAVFRDDGGYVVGFWGLAVVPMPHRLRVAGNDLYAWCAWDPLFLAQIIGDLVVTTEDPETAEVITYRLDSEGTIGDLSHPDSVLSFLRPDREWDDEVMTTFCHHVLHFSRRETAQRWTDRHLGTFVLDLADAVALARQHVERTFGDALP